MMLPPHIIARLRRLVPLLASPVDGEALAARNAIGRELAAGQRDWHDLAAAIGAGVEAAAPLGAAAPAFADLARAARDLDRGQLSPKERGFVMQMCAKGFSWQPSPRQAQWLSDIFERLNAGRAVA